jgi:diadenosine tetraphosphate (Ap4A) HIT family hydrolase
MNRIGRDEAVARVRAGALDACLVCGLLAASTGPPAPLRRTAHATLVLARYALRPGHLLVLANRHVTRFQDLADDEWIDMTRLAHQAARALEQELAPLRCYVASLGTGSHDVPMSSPHLHIHVVPISSADDKPASVLTWQHGVYVDEGAAWEALVGRISSALERVT